MSGRQRTIRRCPALLGHNGGPPLEDPPEPEHVSEWGKGGIKSYFYWKEAHKKVWKSVPYQTMLFRMEKAERCGLTYEEYSMEILERGRYLQPEDVERIAEIKNARKRRRKRKDD